MHFERRPPLLRMPAYPVHYTILHTYARFKLTLHASVTTKHTSRLRPLHQQAAAPSRARCMHCKLFMHFQRASLRRKRPHHHQAHNAPCCFTRYSRTWLTWRVLPCRRHAWKNSAARCSADPHPGWLETFAGRLQRGVSLVSESQASPGGGGGGDRRRRDGRGCAVAFIQGSTFPAPVLFVKRNSQSLCAYNFKAHWERQACVQVGSLMPERRREE